jgi:hypothetical protein
MVRHPPSRWQRVLIVGLALWGLMTIVPDLARPFWHYGTLGFEADNNGFVSDVSATIKAYPKGCIRNDDWIALNPSWHPSKDLLLVYGGMGGLQYVRKDQTANLSVAHAEDGPAHACRISAQALPKGQDNPITDHPAAEFWLPIIAADILGILFIFFSARIVWQHSSPATWGFLLYGVWFNPGQFFAFYAELMPYPWLILAQEFAQSLFQAAGYVGFILFALHFPDEPISPQWRPVYRALPLIGVVLAALQLAGFATAFGFRTEAVSQTFYIAGALVDVFVWVILYLRFRSMPPLDMQRTRWVLWGSAIGLSAFILADLSESTAMLNNVWSPTEPELALLYIVNFAVVIAVYVAVRRHRVFDVRFGLTRVTTYSLVVATAVGALLVVEQFLHEYLQHLIPQFILLLVLGPLLVLGGEELRKYLDGLCNRYFFPRLYNAQQHLEDIKKRFRAAHDTKSVDQLLVNVPTEWLGLASAAMFRKTDNPAFHHLVASVGWDGAFGKEIPSDTKLLHQLCLTDRPVRIGEREALPIDTPSDVAHPVLALPISNVDDELTAVVLFGAHVEGDDILKEELDITDELGREASKAYSRIEMQNLLARLGAHELAAKTVVLDSVQQASDKVS